MSNLYKLTQNLHKIIQEKAKKYGLELVIKSDKIIYWDNFPEKPSDYHIGDSSMLVNAPDWFLKKAVLLIQADQIRQILWVFRDVLGENPEWTRVEKFYSYELCDQCGNADENTKIKSQAEALCHKWLDGLEPLFDREPETVLTELIQILESI